MEAVLGLKLDCIKALVTNTPEEFRATFITRTFEDADLIAGELLPYVSQDGRKIPMDQQALYKEVLALLTPPAAPATHMPRSKIIRRHDPYNAITPTIVTIISPNAGSSQRPRQN